MSTYWKWQTRRLKFVAKVRPSNVDKITREGEATVRLCNYVDVYKNDTIIGDLDFMESSATDAQISTFSLRQGDILITKDSETPFDIGVPAIVDQSAAGVVCGYHLSMIRPTLVDPKFLFWALQAKPVREYFAYMAKGVTRYGLTSGAINDVHIPYPELPMQVAIARFIDAETAKIDRMIGLLGGKQAAATAGPNSMLKLLVARRLLIISAAVTGTINVAMSTREPEMVA